MYLGFLLRSPEGHCEGHFGAMFSNRSDYVELLVIVFGIGKYTNTELPRGGGNAIRSCLCMFCDVFEVYEKELPREGGHAIRSCQCMFRADRPLLPWLHFGLHFGVILGTKFATMLFFGCPGRQQGPPIGTCFSVLNFRVPAGPPRGANKGHRRDNRGAEAPSRTLPRISKG